MHVRAVFAGFNLAPPEGWHWKFLTVVWLLVILPVCFAGLGLITRRLPGMGRVRWELLPALGLAAFTLAGGGLNLLDLAFPPAIWILLAAGFLASAHAAVKAAGAPRPGGSRIPPGRSQKGVWLLVGVVLAVLVPAVVMNLEPGAYNWHDDLQKYFVHPVRMLETGTVFGSPLSAIGAESLGGIAFVQSCVLLWLPIGAINGADAILGLFLCLAPLFAFGLRHPGLRPVAAVAIASTVIIDPNRVNISALFLGSAMIMAAVILTGETDAPDGAFAGGKPAAVSLVYAALVALKPTMLVFVGPHLAAVACVVAAAQSSPRAGLRWGAAAIAGTACFLAPWVLVHLHHYLAPTVPAGGAHPALLHGAVNLLGVETAVAGFSGLRSYTILVGALGALAAVCLGFQPAPPGKSAGRVAAGIAAGLAVCTYPVMLFVFPRVVGYADGDEFAVRYFIPLALGIFPLALCAASQSIEGRASSLSPAMRLGLSVSLGLAPLVAFSGRAVERYRDAVQYGTLQPLIAKAMEFALGSAKQADIRAQQAKIPPGASLIAWIYEPYFLDYARNTIVDAETAGLSNPWGIVPAADYVLWEYRGYPDLHARARYLVDRLPPMNRGRSAPVLEFERRLSEQLRDGTVIFRDEEFVLFRTAQGGR